MTSFIRRYKSRFRYLYRYEKKFSSPAAEMKEKFWAWKHGYSSGMKDMLQLNKSNVDDFLDPLTYRSGHPYNGIYSRLIDNKALLTAFLPSEHLPEIFVVYDKGKVCFSNVDSRFQTENFLRNYSLENTLIFKPLNGSQGRDVRLIFSHNFAVQLDEVIRKKKSVLINEKLSQLEYSSSIFSESVNTIRLILMRNPEDQQIFLASAIHRFGTKSSSPVDNVSSGGLLCPINLETGRLHSCYKFGKNETGWQRNHPDTGVSFENVVIPEWDKITKQILSLFNKIKWFQFGGLDLVFTNKSFKVLEINSLPECCSSQLVQPFFQSVKTKNFFTSKGVIKKSNF